MQIYYQRFVISREFYSTSAKLMRMRDASVTSSR